MVAAGSTAVTFMDEDNRHLDAWLSLTLCSHFTSAVRQQLLERYHDPHQLIEAVLLGDLPQSLERQRCTEKTRQRVKQALEWRDASQDRHLITLTNQAYPAQLACITGAPSVLYVSGQLEALQAPHIAIVGARKATPMALDIASELARDLSSAGVVVVSGLAIGIDGAAHQGCLSAGGRTVAVAATPANVVYPRQHRQLAAEIVTNGAIVTEFALGTPMRRSCFPQRNRIISGLSLATIVVEAALPSGTLLTAKHALDQGREVMVVPGSVRNPLARGCHSLIKDGALLIESANDILGALEPALGKHLPSKNAPSSKTAPVIKEPDTLLLLEILGYDPASADFLSSKSGLSAARVTRILSELELNGVVSRSAGRYTRCK